jgi:hypothetical protein
VPASHRNRNGDDYRAANYNQHWYVYYLCQRDADQHDDPDDDVESIGDADQHDDPDDDVESIGDADQHDDPDDDVQSVRNLSQHRHLDHHL